MNDTIIREVLWSCGLSGRYRGFPLLVTAIQICIEDEERSLAVSGSLYARVAERCHCPVYRVERNLRTMVSHAWKINKEYLQEIAGYPLHSPPTSSEFINIIVSYILRAKLFESV